MDRLSVLLALGAGVAVAIQGPMNTTLMRSLGVFGASVAFYAVAFVGSIICVAIFGLSLAFFARWRASSTDQQSGFCT